MLLPRPAPDCVAYAGRGGVEGREAREKVQLALCTGRTGVCCPFSPHTPTSSTLHRGAPTLAGCVSYHSACGGCGQRVSGAGRHATELALGWHLRFCSWRRYAGPDHTGGTGTGCVRCVCGGGHSGGAGDGARARGVRGQPAVEGRADGRLLLRHPRVRPWPTVQQHAPRRLRRDRPHRVPVRGKPRMWAGASCPRHTTTTHTHTTTPFTDSGIFFHHPMCTLARPPWTRVQLTRACVAACNRQPWGGAGLRSTLTRALCAGAPSKRDASSFPASHPSRRERCRRHCSGTCCALPNPATASPSPLPAGPLARCPGRLPYATHTHPPDTPTAPATCMASVCSPPDSPRPQPSSPCRGLFMRPGRMAGANRKSRATGYSMHAHARAPDAVCARAQTAAHRHAHDALGARAAHTFVGALLHRSAARRSGAAGRRSTSCATQPGQPLPPLPPAPSSRRRRRRPPRL